MKPEKAAFIAVENAGYHFDKPYTYAVPQHLSDSVRPGCRVMVPFGQGNRLRQGIITGLSDDEDLSRAKCISSLLDDEPILNSEMLALGAWLKERTFCTAFEAYKALLPAGITMRTVENYSPAPDVAPEKVEALPDPQRQICLMVMQSKKPLSLKSIQQTFCSNPVERLLVGLVKNGYLQKTQTASRRVGDAGVRMARLTSADAESLPGDLTAKQKAVVKLLTDAGTACVKELCYLCGVTQAVVNTLEKKGVVEFYEKEIYRDPYRERKMSPSADEIILTPQQQTAYEQLVGRCGKGGASLLFGVTGSGKTQVFLKLIDNVLPTGKGVIVMVPEISLTAQTLSIFHKRYGNKVAVLHSGLSVGERLDEWKRIRSGEAQIAVGTRSAVFAPFESLALVIMDEEQEGTYKSECTPRYHARDVARFRCAHHAALLVLASATPAVETYTAALSGRFSLSRMTQRYGSAQLPEVIPVDMRQEMSQGNAGAISGRLLSELKQNLSDGRQSILLMNRRGYHTFVSCRSCGHVLTCPHCSISLTYHRANERLVCHYCGYSEPLRTDCPSCGGEAVRYSGTGTQKLEEELSQLLPSARILRMDADTTMARFAHEKGLAAFARGDYDILLGTQMVAKGLNFENVTLVGVVSADQSLYNDDYRSLEKTFALLTQVVGRSGRGKYPGRAVIQTTAPEHPVIRMAAAQDYEAFYETEIQARKFLVYPPYCDICAIGFIGINENAVDTASRLFLQKLKQANTAKYKDQKMIVLGPMPARISRVSGKYRYRLVIKCKNSTRFRSMLREVLDATEKETAAKKVSVYIDMDPDGGL